MRDSQALDRAKELLETVRHAAMATVNADGSPHNTPYRFMCNADFMQLYWASHPAALHSQNVARTGQLFVVLYDAQESGGLYIRADAAHVAEGAELAAGLLVHNALRTKEGKEPLEIEYYQTEDGQRLYTATIRQAWVNTAERDAHGRIIRDLRYEITPGDLA